MEKVNQEQDYETSTEAKEDHTSVYTQDLEEDAKEIQETYYHWTTAKIAAVENVDKEVAKIYDEEAAENEATTTTPALYDDDIEGIENKNRNVDVSVKEINPTQNANQMDWNY